MLNLLKRSRAYAPHAAYGLTAGTVVGAPGSEYYGPVLAAVGNVLDLPGSAVRDVLAGENPFDQFASPLTSDNRLTGRDVLDRWGVTAPNKETGMSGWLQDPMEGLRDLAGFGVEILTDPLNVVSALKVGKLLRARQGASTHNAALEALQRNPERQRLGREMADAYGEAGEHTMTLLDAATIANKKDPNLVYGGITAKRLEAAAAGIAATSAIIDQSLDSPLSVLEQPALPGRQLTPPDDASLRMLYQAPLEGSSPRGAIRFEPSGTTLQAIEPDASTAPHEMSHYMRRRFLPGGAWSREREEAFAGGFENFVTTKPTSSPAMADAFEYFGREIPRVYDPQMGFRNMPPRGGYSYENLLGLTDTSSPLDPKQVPGLATPAGLALVRNILSRFSQHGGV